MRRFATVVLIAVCSVGASKLEAQCADGSPPPCAAPTRVAARESARPPDPNRIAILPFRVTTTDTLLGEGFAELLATEFTGEGAPQAIDMATVLSAWRRAGGGLRTPLPREKAMQVARQVGAGLVSEGSIVGLGRNITVTASLFNTTDGAVRGAPTRVTASSDSLEAALRQAATSLLGALGGAQRTSAEVRYTESPEAMRSYLQGLAAWRRGRIREAAEDFDRAIAADSSFAQAWFRRYFVALWRGGTAPFQRPTWERRARLSPQERTVLEGILGAEYPRPRLIEERYADRERAAARLPDSPDALYLFGDYAFHYGAAVDPVNQLTRARDYMVRAAAIDSATTTLRHLIEVGVRLRDTALLRSVLPAYLRTEDEGRIPGAWLAAATIGDAATTAALRRRNWPTDQGESFWVGGAALMANVPAVALDELFTRWVATAPPQRRGSLLGLLGFIQLSRGRPSAAQRWWNEMAQSERPEVSGSLLTMLLADADIGLDPEPVFRQLRAATHDTSVNDPACMMAVWRARRGDTTGLDFSRFVAPRASAPCRQSLEIVRIPRDGSAAARARLVAADSVLRNRFGSATAFYGFEPYLMAVAWEANGEPRRALTAVRYRLVGLGPAEGPWTLAYEGHLAAAVGDTASAIRAYRTWLEITADAEPFLAAKRDSVRAELARLTRKAQP